MSPQARYLSGVGALLALMALVTALYGWEVL
jgi:hypothetical protein